MTAARKPPAFIPTLTRTLDGSEESQFNTGISVDLPLHDVPDTPKALQTLPDVTLPVQKPTENYTSIDQQQQAAQLTTRLLQRVDLILERRVREAAAAVALEHAQNMAREMKPILEQAIRDAVNEALELEIAAKASK